MEDPNPGPKREDGPFYLGLDLSTQAIKAVVTNDALQIVYEASVNFDHDLPEFGTSGGVNRDPTTPKVVTAQPIMWIKALDLVLEKLRLLEPPFHLIAGISGAGQQHGSVYWRRGASATLASLNPDKFLHDQLPFSFAIQHSPIWMDSSTTPYCDWIEAAVGGKGTLASITGSRAYERFTGAQICKIFQTRREAYNATERISLVSSFAASIFLGAYASIDYSDGSGMNLLNIRDKTWSPECLSAVASSPSEPSSVESVATLAAKLGPPVPCEAVLGKISPYFVERYGFSEDCRIVAFTGDNPSSFAGMGLGPTDIAVSLGTSDTIFLSMPGLPPGPGFGEGHIFVNPIQSQDHFMALLCFKNGSLTRERIRRDFAGGSWSIFNELLDSTPRGNFGNIGFYFDLWEIIPKIKNGDHKFTKEGKKLAKFTSNEVEVRALIEGQFLARRLHAEQIGCKITKDTKILATGGASANPNILQVLSDVFNAPVFVQDSANSSDLGACYRIKHALFGADQPFEKVIDKVASYRKACDPNKDAKEIYDKMLQRFAMLEEMILSS